MTSQKKTVVAAAFLISAFYSSSHYSSSLAAQPEKLDTGFYRTEYAKPGDWLVIRFSSDRAGKKDRMCTALKVRESDMMVRFSFDAQHKEFSYGLSAPRPDDNSAAKLTVWFNGNKASTVASDADYLLDADGGEYLSVTRTNATPAAADMFSGQDSISFLYKFEKADRTETFQLAGIKPALAKLFDCAAGR